MCLESYICTLYRGHSHLQGHVFPRGLEIRVRVIIMTPRARIQIYIFYFLSRGIILWIELQWPENPANTYAQHTETLNSCFDLIRSLQQCISWSPPLEIKPSTTEYRAETLPLSHQPILHTSDAKLTSHGNCSQLTWMCLTSYICTLYRGHSHIQGHVFPRGLEIRVRVIIMTPRVRIQIYIFYFLSRGIILELNYNDQKIRQTPPW